MFLSGKPTAPSSSAPAILNNRLRSAVAQTVSLRSWLALISISRENAQCRSGLESGGSFSRNSLFALRFAVSVPNSPYSIINPFRARSTLESIL